MIIPNSKAIFIDDSIGTSHTRAFRIGINDAAVSRDPWVVGWQLYGERLRLEQERRQHRRYRTRAQCMLDTFNALRRAGGKIAFDGPFLWIGPWKNTP